MIGDMWLEHKEAWLKPFLLNGPDTTELWLIRHAEAASYSPSTLERFEGASPLTERGGEQARIVAERLSRIHFDRLYSSTIPRAVVTAEAISQKIGLALDLRPELREISLTRVLKKGETSSEGAREEVRSSMHKLTMGTWKQLKFNAIPHIEDIGKFRRRVVTAVDSIGHQNPGKRVAIICHGGVINAYVADLLGTYWDMFFYPWNTSITVVHVAKGHKALQRLNDCLHLEEGCSQCSLLS